MRVRRCDGLHVRLSVQFLPVYVPSEEEIHDPKLFGNNVRDVMAKWVMILFIFTELCITMAFQQNINNSKMQFRQSYKS